MSSRCRLCKRTRSRSMNARQRTPSHLTSNRWSSESNGPGAATASIGLITLGNISILLIPQPAVEHRRDCVWWIGLGLPKSGSTNGPYKRDREINAVVYDRDFLG